MQLCDLKFNINNYNYNAQLYKDAVTYGSHSNALFTDYTNIKREMSTDLRHIIGNILNFNNLVLHKILPNNQGVISYSTFLQWGDVCSNNNNIIRALGQQYVNHLNAQEGINSIIENIQLSYPENEYNQQTFFHMTYTNYIQVDFNITRETEKQLVLLKDNIESVIVVGHQRQLLI